MACRGQTLFRMNDRLEPDAAREILRRAAEIEADKRAAAPDVARESLEEAAAEVGISPDAVRRAVAEHGVGAIPAVPPAKNLLGPADVHTVASVDLPVATVEARVTKFLRSQVLSVSRRRPDGVEWTPRDDLGARLRRRVDFNKRIRLDGVDRVLVSISDAGDGRSLLRIEVGFENTRRGLRTGATGAAIGIPIAGAIAAFAVQEPLLFAAGFPAGAAVGSAGVFVSRKVLAAQLEEAQRVIELFVSELN